MFINWMQGTTSTTGTGPLTISSTSGFTPFSALTNGATVPYQLLTADGLSRESGIGTWNSSNSTLTRTTIRATLNGGTYNNTTATALTLPSGYHTIWSDITEVEAGNWGTMSYSASLGDGTLTNASGTISLPSQLGLQRGSYLSCVNSGTSDALVGSFSPAITNTTLGTNAMVVVSVLLNSTNTTTTPTFTPNTGVVSANTIVGPGNTTIGVGDFISGHWITIQWDATYGKWVCIKNTSGASDLAVSSPLMDGTAAVGSSSLKARQDHVHPTDTTRAPLNSPAFTGIPTAPTAGSAVNTTQVASTAFVQAVVSDAKYSPAFTGIPTAPTAASFTNSTQIASTEFVQAVVSDAKFSPAFTGIPTAPTAASFTNSTQIASTAFVQAVVNSANWPPMPTSSMGTVGQWVGIGSASNSVAYLPSSGTWAYVLQYFYISDRSSVGVAAGGTQVGDVLGETTCSGFAWRIA